MDVAASEFYGSDKTYDLNFKEEVIYLLLQKAVDMIFIIWLVKQKPCRLRESLISFKLHPKLPHKL